MSELLSNCYDLQICSYPKLYEINKNKENLIENFALSSTSIPIVSCVNELSNIYYADSALQTNPSWTLIPGGLSCVSVSNGQLYGVNSANNIYYASNYKNPTWVQVPGGLSQVSFDAYANVVCGVNSSNQIFYADTNIQSNPNWTLFKSGSLKSVCVSNGRVAGIGTDNKVWYSNNYQNASWVNINNNISGNLIQVSYDGYNNTICCITTSNEMYYASTNISSSPNWTLLPGGRFLNISVSNGHLYGIGTDNNAYYSDVYNSTNFLNVTLGNKIGKLTQISFDGYNLQTLPSNTTTTTTPTPSVTTRPSTTTTAPSTTPSVTTRASTTPSVTTTTTTAPSITTLSSTTASITTSPLTTPTSITTTPNSIITTSPITTTPPITLPFILTNTTLTTPSSTTSPSKTTNKTQTFFTLPVILVFSGLGLIIVTLFILKMMKII